MIRNLRELAFIDFLRQLLPNFIINWFWHFPKAVFALKLYKSPSKKLKIIGVTGTDGKTTTATLIYQVLRLAKLKVALISTVEAKIGSDNLPTGLHVTSPNPFELQRLLKLIADQGYNYVVLEVTSHGLDQFRLLGVDFSVGVITNITHEHLDYHKGWDNYLMAKAKLFKSVSISILNKEDKSYQRLKKLASGEIITYGLKNADYTLDNYAFKTRLLGEYNKLNCLAAISTAKALNIEDSIIKKAILDFKGVIGRMDEIKMGQNFKVFVDFAHTPNALKNALETLKKLPHKKLIAVFGCAGLRDVKKRPMMGRIACKLADKVVLTAEDPRTEDINRINKQIIAGCQQFEKVVKNPDRQKAINLAIIELAEKDDIVAIFGKGHEQSLCFGTKESPWSDHQAVKKALRIRLKRV